MSLLSFTLATVANPDSAAKPVPLRIPMAARAQHDDIIAKAIEARKLQIAGDTRIGTTQAIRMADLNHTKSPTRIDGARAWA